MAAMTKSESHGLALVGNPGVGKSTILNGIAGRPVFKSGASINTGLTTTLDRYESNGIILYDTPGLADIETKKQAGKELDSLLLQEVDIKLCFVVTLEAGRVRNDDAATIDVVLSAIKSVDVNDKFGVIVNQVTENVARQMENNPEAAAKMRNSLTGKFSTSYWLHVPMEDSLKDVDNSELSSVDVITFFASLPHTKPQKAEVVAIDTAGLEDKKEEHRMRIMEVEAKHKAETQQMVQQYQTELEQAQSRMAKIQAGYEDIAREHAQSQQAHRDLEASNAQLALESERAREESQLALRRVDDLQTELARSQYEASIAPDEKSDGSRRKGRKSLAAGVGMAAAGVATINPILLLAGLSSLTFGVGRRYS